MADYGALLFTIKQDEIVYEHNLTNIAYTHGTMEVKPMTVKQIDDAYAKKVFLSSKDIAQKLGTNKKVLYVLNRPGIQGGYIGWWHFGQRSLDSIEWVVLVGNNDLIQYVFRRSDIQFETRNKKKGFKANGLENHIGKLKPVDGDACFDVNGKGWNPFGNAYTYL